LTEGKWFIIYTELCEQKIVTFTKRETVNAFLSDFLLQYQNNDDSFIDVVGRGTIDYSNLEE
jgi:hypothetical protein